jgi:hypothetical protein
MKNPKEQLDLIKFNWMLKMELALISKLSAIEHRSLIRQINQMQNSIYMAAPKTTIKIGFESRHRKFLLK